MITGRLGCKIGMCVMAYVEASLFPSPFTQVLTVQVPDSGVGILSTALCLSPERTREVSVHYLVLYSPFPKLDSYICDAERTKYCQSSKQTTKLQSIREWIVATKGPKHGSSVNCKLC